MKSYLLLPCLLFVLACNNEKKNDASAKDSTIVITNDTIPETRDFVSSKPIATFSENVNDELNDWKFSVSVYETKKRFRFILRIQYKELRVTDSLTIPNFGIEPQPDLRKGPEPLSCIVGFLDKKGEFKPYRKAAIKKDQLKLTQVASYYVGSYKTPQK